MMPPTHSSSKALWYGVSLLLGSSVEQEGELVHLAKERWEECLACCDDPAVLKGVLGAAFQNQQPAKADICMLASLLVQHSLEPQAKGLELLEQLLPFAEKQPCLLLYAAGELRKAVLQLCCSGGIASPADQQRLQARQVELLICLMESQAPTVVHLAEQLAGVQGDPAGSMPGAGSLLAELFSGTVSSASAPLPMRLRASKLLALCCAASSTVLRQYRGCLESILRHEASMDLVHVAACGLFESFFMHMDSFVPGEWRSMRASLGQGLACAVPSIQLPAAVGAFRVLLHGWEASSACAHEEACQEALEGLLEQLVQMVCGLAGRLGPINWSDASGIGSSLALSSPHSFSQHHLLHLLGAGLSQLGAAQPQALLQGLCDAVGSAVDKGVLQVDVLTGEVQNNDFAIQEVLRLKAKCGCLARVLQNSSNGTVGREEICQALADRLVVVTVEGVRAWLEH